MPPAQEGLGELLRDEAQLQEHADGELTQQLGEASGVVDGEEVELAIRALAVSDETAAAQGVEAALEDQGRAFRRPCLGAVLPSMA